MDAAARNRQRWFYEMDLQFAKFNHARGIGEPDDELLKNVPHEMRFMLPLNPNAADSPAFSEGLPALPDDPITEHPMTKYLAASNLAKLAGLEASTPPETDWDKFLRKLVGESEQLVSNGRTSLPTRTVISGDGGPLEKAFAVTEERNLLAGLAEWVSRALLRGESIEGLAKFARAGGDAQRADQILEIGRRFQLAAA